jgi:hypothetical protein
MRMQATSMAARDLEPGDLIRYPGDGSGFGVTTVDTTSNPGVVYRVRP